MFVMAFIAGCCLVSLQNGDARMFNDFLPELKMTVVNKGRSNFWQEIVEGMSRNSFC